MQLPTVLLLAVATSTTVDAFVVSPGWTKMTTTSQRYASSSSSPVSEEDVLARAAECINDADSCSAQEIETLFERVRSMENGGWDELGNVEDTLLSQLAMLQTEEAEVEQQKPVLLPYLEQLSSASTTVEKQEIVDSMVASVAQSYLDTLNSRQKTMSRNAASSVTDAYLDDCTNEGIKNKTKKRRGLVKKGLAMTASFLANLGRGGEKQTTTIATEQQEAKDEPAVAAPEEREIPVTAQGGKFDEILQQAEEEAEAADNDDDNVASESVSEGSTFTQLIERAAAVATNDEDGDTELEDMDGALGLVAGGLLVLAFISQIFH